jgi:hypothetical protein
MGRNTRRGSQQATQRTAGSPVTSSVCIRILPTGASLQTDLSVISMVTPARTIDTPAICSSSRGYHDMGADRYKLIPWGNGIATDLQ